MHHQARNDIAMAQIVEQGINRDLLHGCVLAWSFLAANKVPDAVILRVLAEPSMRRLATTATNDIVRDQASFAAEPDQLLY